MVLLIDQTLLGQGLVKVRDNVVFMAGQPMDGQARRIS